jgi:multidrug transporter EmrE-like cation transporter
MVAMTKFTLSYAYPFVSLSFVLVLICSNIFFKDPITVNKSIGMGLIILGVVFGSKV